MDALHAEDFLTQTNILEKGKRKTKLTDYFFQPYNIITYAMQQFKTPTEKHMARFVVFNLEILDLSKNIDLTLSEI